MWFEIFLKTSVVYTEVEGGNFVSLGSNSNDVIQINCSVLLLRIENSIFIGQTAGAEYLKSKDPVFLNAYEVIKMRKENKTKFTTQSDFGFGFFLSFS